MPLPIGGLYQVSEKGMPKHPLLDRSRPLSRRLGCFPSMGPILRSARADYSCSEEGRRLFAIGPEVWHFYLGGKITWARIPFPPGGYPDE